MDKNSTMVPFYYAHYMMFNDILKKLYKIWNGVTGTPRPYAKLTSLSSSSNLSLLLYRQVWKGLKWDQSCHRTVREKANGSVTQNVKHWFSHLCEEVLGGCASGGRGDHLLGDLVIKLGGLITGFLARDWTSSCSDTTIGVWMLGVKHLDTEISPCMNVRVNG